MRIAVSRRLWSLVLAALLSLATGSGARADLVIEIGPHSATETYWTFSGTSTARADDTVRVTNTTGIDLGDTWEIGGNPVASSVVDTLFNVTSGSATITVGGTTQSITQIYLDGPDTNGNDDFGIRVDSALAYTMNDASSWTGTIVLPIAISDLQLGSYTLASIATPGPNFANGAGELDINIVPEPSSMAMIGLAGLFGGAVRFRRRRKALQGASAAA